MKRDDVRQFEKFIAKKDWVACAAMLEKDPKAVARYNYYWGEEISDLQDMAQRMSNEFFDDLRTLLCPRFYG